MTHTLKLSVAPMMERTDRHFRYLMRLVSPGSRLYTEMITSAALLNGNARSLLAFDVSEHPVAAQLGGGDPRSLAAAAVLVENAGYDEVNLNVGCPSSRVQAGDFGARLMLEPERVADCVAAMVEATRLPVTVKTRIGVDDRDDYDMLRTLTAAIVEAGVSGIIVHARKAWLTGLSPKQNREVPPLNYSRVYRLKSDFPSLPIEINGGFCAEADVLAQVGKVDGVMLGRAAYDDPMLVGRLDRRLNGTDGADALSVSDLLARYAVYMRREADRGTPLRAMLRHLMGLVRAQHGARQWRRRIGELARVDAPIDELIAELAGMTTVTRYNAGSAGHSAT